MNMASRALKYEPGVPTGAHFACETVPGAAPFNPGQPPTVSAFVVLLKFNRHFLNTTFDFDSGELTRCLSSNHFTCPSKKTMLVPLIALTGLPFATTNIAELRTALASKRS
jgi:hypothetical protein